MVKSLPGAESGSSEVVLYEAPSGEVRLDVRLDRDTVWLRQAQMADLFGRERSVVTKHLRNAFADGELEADSVCANFAHTAADGKTYQVEHYNLDVIISVGYRVKSAQGTRFRQWATRLLREHLVKGHTPYVVWDETGGDALDRYRQVQPMDCERKKASKAERAS